MTDSDAQRRVLIAGAGLTGALTCALLKQRDPTCRVTCVEMARGPGGRMSTTRFAVSAAPPQQRANVGAQVKKLLLAHGAQLDAPAEEELMSEEDEKATPVSTSQGDADLNEIFKPGQGEKQMMQKRQESQIMFQAGARKVILLQAGKLSPGYLQGWKVESGKLSPTSRPAAAS